MPPTLPIASVPAARPRRKRTTAPPDVSVCIPNWNCRDHLDACLRSLTENPQGVRVEVVVVDNGSTDGAADLAAERYPDVVLARNADNRGFARASNQAAALARGRYLFFLNNDTEVPAGTLGRLVAFADANPAVAIVGPKLLDPNGQIQGSVRGRPTVGALLHRTFPFVLTGLYRKTYARYRRGTVDPELPTPVEALMGAALLVRSEAFAAAGGWDEGFRFGVEDVDLCRRVGRAVYFPQAQVVHHGRVSTRRNVEFAYPSLLVGYVRYFRLAKVSRPAVWAYKLAVTLDAPPRLLAKAFEWGLRRLRGQRRTAERSAVAVRGLWRFLSRELVRFWRA